MEAARADRAKSFEILIQDERVDLYLVDKTGKNIWDLAGPVAKMVLDIMLPVILFLSKKKKLLSSPLSLLFFHLYIFTKKKKGTKAKEKEAVDTLKACNWNLMTAYYTLTGTPLPRRVLHKHPNIEWMQGRIQKIIQSVPYPQMRQVMLAGLNYIDVEEWEINELNQRKLGSLYCFN
ncbi:hypothetical protein RFI_22321 [Reticulomyxa filosa]|uniref:Uncharacterized protein n=1 Tax=Reticulomyxa filosa TaxID=46433 RepID=X6MM02_RETFI|nr:hypothetical protein RFI_22321 [Reticulomyxa filosa]|eukprot:ETO15043.1 hypothetical protein RFI_22321 [Reticulomyxa filosa]